MIDAPVGDRSQWQPRWPEVQPYFVPLGSAILVREGSDATIVSYGRTLPLCSQAADQLKNDQGLTFDVLDLRSIFPYDWIAISRSILKTGRVFGRPDQRNPRRAAAPEPRCAGGRTPCE